MGKQAAFTVYADKTVVFQCDDKIYGTYKATEDPTAVPENEDMAGRMRGVELSKDDEILFLLFLDYFITLCFLFILRGVFQPQAQLSYHRYRPSVDFYHIGGAHQAAVFFNRLYVIFHKILLLPKLYINPGFCQLSGNRCEKISRTQSLTRSHIF